MPEKRGGFLDRKGISRRELFRLAWATGAGLTLGGATLAAKGIVNCGSGTVGATVPFFGRNQAGIATPQQDHLCFAAFDLTTDEVAEVRDLLREWSAAAMLMSGGQPGDGPAWMREGTYLVARRIRMFIEVWDRSSLNDQEQTIGRHRGSGAPIGSENEFDPVNLEAKGPGGHPLVPTDSHVRLSGESPDEKILRRGYSFTDGMDLERGQLDAGLFFICFQRDPEKQFVPLQRRLAENDTWNEYISHTGSSLFACPPGRRESGYVGESLFESA